MMEPTEAEQFFYEHAGYSYDRATETAEQGRRRGARVLAMAEKKLINGPYFVSREPDPDPWDGDVPYDGPLWVITLWSVAGTAEPVALASLGSVACEPSDSYMRVVAAELAAEHLG